MNNVKFLLRLARSRPDLRPRGRCFGCCGTFPIEEMLPYYYYPLQFSNDPDFPEYNFKHAVCEWCDRQFSQRNQRFTCFEEWLTYWSSFDLGEGIFQGRPGIPRSYTLLHSPVPLRCHFCGDLVGYLDEMRRPVNIHHKQPKREFADPAEANRLENLVYAHEEPCHILHNQIFDPPHLHRKPYVSRMSRFNLAEGIFKDVSLETLRRYQTRRPDYRAP